MKNLYDDKRKCDYKMNSDFMDKRNYRDRHAFDFLEIDDQEKNSFSLKWKERIERFQMMYTLCKMREILIEERNKGYYRNMVNVKEIIELENGAYTNEDGVEYITTQKMQMYQNGMVDFFTVATEKGKTRELIK